METVHDTDVGVRGTRADGHARDDRQVHDGRATPDAPARLREDDAARRSTRAWRCPALARHGQRPAPRRVRAAIRAVVLARAARSRRRAVGRDGLLVHTHASEQRDEVALVRSAHRPGQHRVLRRRRAGVAALCASRTACGSTTRSRRCWPSTTSRSLHCPGSNLKLGSGIAPVAEMRARGICVSLGADGAACNNHLDMFGEMRLAATLQAMRLRPGRAARARRAVDGDARRRPRARARRRDRLDRGRQAGRPHPRRRGGAAPGAGARSLLRRSSTRPRPSDVRTDDGRRRGAGRRDGHGGCDASDRRRRSPAASARLR